MHVFLRKHRFSQIDLLVLEDGETFGTGLCLGVLSPDCIPVSRAEIQLLQGIKCKSASNIFHFYLENDKSLMC